MSARKFSKVSQRSQTVMPRAPWFLYASAFGFRHRVFMAPQLRYVGVPSKPCFVLKCSPIPDLPQHGVERLVNEEWQASLQSVAKTKSWRYLHGSPKQI